VLRFRCLLLVASAGWLHAENATVGIVLRFEKETDGAFLSLLRREGQFVLSPVTLDLHWETEVSDPVGVYDRMVILHEWGRCAALQNYAPTG